MNITRRSFVKRTAFTAAAVTVLGQGVALATNTGLVSCNKYDKISKYFTIHATIGQTDGGGVYGSEESAWDAAVAQLETLLRNGNLVTPGPSTSGCVDGMTECREVVKVPLAPQPMIAIKPFSQNGTNGFVFELTIPEGGITIYYYK
ncbi:hypothetical protein [Roseibacillus ishigakijimensis]|uniref:Tat (Twin-arginine translocation) pathway signal sequence n=1 Tax=Roseibacillus ishigakijimensis TaxID=454146 RepID=A0A934VLX0_9BACT|nr:hypothetical protein [Roseibacillus ishigakijimensis]MBK1833521.1 hypothetical protein [Roseibacillus ishigakijimensis]